MTVPIKDRGRADIAYNLMYAIAEDKAEYTDAICHVDGKDIPMTADALSLVDAKGEHCGTEIGSGMVWLQER